MVPFCYRAWQKPPLPSTLHCALATRSLHSLHSSTTTSCVQPLRFRVKPEKVGAGKLLVSDVLSSRRSSALSTVGSPPSPSFKEKKSSYDVELSFDRKFVSSPAVVS